MFRNLNSSLSSLLRHVHSREPVHIHQILRQSLGTICAASLQSCLPRGDSRSCVPTHNRHEQESVPKMAGRMAVDQKNGRLDRLVLHDAAHHRYMSHATADRSLRRRPERNGHQNEQVRRNATK
jgi:hypothetical protein